MAKDEFINCRIRISPRTGLFQYTHLGIDHRPADALNHPQFCGYVHIDTKGNESDLKHVTELASTFANLMEGEQIVVRFI